ncbi:MAG: hypothetical protein ABJH63_08705 [Rhizobiaceae bacterium]
MPFTRFICAVIVVVGVSTSWLSTAAELSGAKEPAFLSAVDTWLDDNDADSLPVLASLARNGNVAARLLLARMEMTDWAPSDYVRGLSRAERLNLFRAESKGSKFRSSWLKVEKSAGNPVAAALLQSAALGVNIDTIRTLYEIGEIEATYHLVVKVAVEGSLQEREELAGIIAANSELAPYLRAFHHSQDTATTGRTALQHMIGMIREVEPASVKLGADSQLENAKVYVEFGFRAGSKAIDFGKDNRFYDALSAWVLNSEEGKPIANLCRRACPGEELTACANIAFGLVGGYYEAIRFDSPLEAIIPQARYLSSIRATGMALRRIALARSEADELPLTKRVVREQSICLAEAVAPAGARSD